MNFEIEKTIDGLTTTSVSIKTTRYVMDGGMKLQVGLPSRIAYMNSIIGRERLRENEPKDIFESVMARWGDKATVRKTGENEIVTSYLNK